MSDQALEEARAEAVAHMATAIRHAIVSDVAFHGKDDPMMPSIVGAALVLVILELTTNVDSTLAPTVIVQLGGQPFQAGEEGGQ